MRTSNKRIPFRLDRLKPASLTQQTANGFKEAIRNGRYPPGSHLPRMVDIAQELGICYQVVFNAMQLLAKESVIVIRRRAGTTVLRPRQGWSRHILFLYRANTYYFATRDQRFADLMDEERIRVSTVLLDHKEYSRGLLKTCAVLDFQPVDLILVEGDPIHVDQKAFRLKIPLLCLIPTRPVTRPCAKIMINDEGPLRDLAEHFRECGVRTVGVVQEHTRFTETRRILDAAGLAGTLIGHPPHGNIFLQQVEEAGWQLVEKLLQQERRLPDALFFTDDHMARGGWACLRHHGIEIPKKLQIAAITNRGHCPVLAPGHLTRIETDPIQHAEAMARGVKQALTGETGIVEVLSRRLILGQTTRTA